MFTIKVGVMPGKLQEVVVDGELTAKEIFELAEVDYEGHEIRLDGNRINIDEKVNNGNLLVAMKMIKGNANIIKVGIMPGKLQEVEFTPGEIARHIFEKVEIDTNNMEIRLDGNKIDIDTRIENGNLLVAMKMIKGNSSTVTTSSEVYVTDLTLNEIEMMLNVELPTRINKADVVDYGICVDVFDNAIDRDLFYSIYTLIDEQQEFMQECELFQAVNTKEEAIDIQEVQPIQQEKNKQGENYILSRIETIESRKEYYYREYLALDRELSILKDVLENL